MATTKKTTTNKATPKAEVKVSNLHTVLEGVVTKDRKSVV